MQSQIRVGVIGAGVSATTFHAPFIKANPAFNLVKFHRSSQKPVSGYEAIPVVTDLGSFLSSPPEIDLVVITTPTNTHYQLARACLDSGKHVILEKPMTAAADEAKELCDVARANNKLLAVYQNRRWDGDYQTVEKLVACGSLGRVVEYESHFDRFRNTVKPGWKEEDLPGSGILYDLGSHLIDQALCLFGSPTAITAKVLNQRQLPASKVPDAFTVTLHYENSSPAPTSHLELPQLRSENLTTAAATGSFTGPSVSALNPIENLAGSVTAPMSHRPLTVTLKASMLTKISGPRFVIHGTQGSFIKHGMDVQEGQLRSGMLVTDPGFGVEDPEGFGTLDSLALDPPGSAAAAAAPAVGAAAISSSSSSSGVPTADAAAVAAGVLAKVDSGGVAAAAGAAASSGAVIKIATERGRWMEFYNNIAEVLQAKEGLDAEGTRALGSIAEAPAGSAAAAAAAAAAAKSGSKDVNLNNMLAVQPEQAVQVIRLIEAAMQSSAEGRTVYFKP